MLTSASPCSTTPHLMVISSDGYLYVYSIDLEQGGKCVLVKQYLCVASLRAFLSPPLLFLYLL
jgi:hypothetical protein